ncbi:MAG TPA: 50S ribosomal protein L9 [Candidatus Paceibacterota bacterium]|nr:50S ribosomal protein L9 [Candidatus Paceibacterota bacterium]
MKVILMRDLKGIGRAHDEIMLADGYALNYLIPKKFAIPATAVAKREAETRRRQAVDRSALDAALVAQNIASLAEARIIIRAKANEKGHLYDAVGESDIRNAVKEQTRVDLPDTAIKLEKPFKELGTFDVPVSAGEAFGRFSITIEAEE